MIRILFVAMCMCLSVPVFAQTPELPAQDMVARQEFPIYPELDNETAAARLGERAPGEIAQPRQPRQRVYPPVTRRPVPYDWHVRQRRDRRFRAHRYVCTPSYYAWIGPVRVFIPSTCY